MNSFEGLGINAEVLKALAGLGFKEPTPIQKQSIPLLLSQPTDLVALAQTGTGKTAAFGIPLILGIDTKSRDAQALVLCPTRELCLQITKDLQSFSKYIKGLKVVAIYGGASIVGQIKEVKEGAQIIVGTPGRMVDMIDRKAISLKKVSRVVLDEADEMLSMGFQDDLNEILSDTPKQKNTWLFSATMSKEVSSIARKYMNSPQEITVGNKNQGATNIEHIYYLVNERDKYPALKRIADFYPDIFAIVFCRTKIETQKVADLLIKDGYNADALHGDLSQAQRDFVMKRYRSRTLQMLVATDVAARGIDVNDVTHVINYNIPDELESYTHRSGRTARAGKSGYSIILASPRDMGKIKTLEKITGKKFTKEKIPGGIEVCGKQLLSLIKKVHDVEVNEAGILPFMPDVLRLLNDLSKEELIKRFVSVEFNRFLEYYKNAHDLNMGEHGSRASSSGKRLFINLGKLDGMSAQELESYFNDITQKAIKFQQADIKNAYSFVEVSDADASSLLSISGLHEFNGRPVKIESSERSGGGGESRGRKYGHSGGGNGRSYHSGGGGERRYGRSGGGRGDNRGGDGGYRKKKFSGGRR